MKSCLLGGCGVASDGGAMPRLDGSKRMRRGVAGVLFSAIGAGLFLGPWPLWPLAVVAIWFGISHVAAAVIAYAGCPELGAIPSLLLRRHLRTACGPWRAIDRRLDGDRPA